MQHDLKSNRGVNEVIIVLLALLAITACVGSLRAAAEPELEENGMNIIFLHHSTGDRVWKGGIPEWFERYNGEHGTDYRIEKRSFPKPSPYGWNNYPYDYWNIWVRNAGSQPYLEEPTLELLTNKYDVIVFKHCFPVSEIQPDTGNLDIASTRKSLENYKLQYAALKIKLREFPTTKFIVWTAPPLTGTVSLKTRIVALMKRKPSRIGNAERARAFAAWVRSEWDEAGDNIFIWDFHELATGGGFFLKNEYATAPGDSHPNDTFAKIAVQALSRRIVDVIEGRGDSANTLGMRENTDP